MNTRKQLIAATINRRKTSYTEQTGLSHENCLLFVVGSRQLLISIEYTIEIKNQCTEP